MKNLKPIALAILLFQATKSQAQEVIISGEALYNSTFSLTNGSIMGAAIRAKFPKQGSVNKLNANTLNFVRSEKLNQDIQHNYINSLSKNQPTLKPLLNYIFANNKLRNQFDKLLKDYKYNPTNLADALTACLVISWQIIHNESFNDKNGFDAVRKNIQENLLSSAELRDASDATKQRVTEIFGYQAMMALNTYKVSVAEKDKIAFNKLRSEIQANTKSAGMDLSTLKLTNKGFIKN